MARQVITSAEVLTYVSGKITAAGGKITNRALQSAMQTDGKTAYADFLPVLLSNGQLNAAMEFPEGGSLPVRTYSLPS